MNDHLPARKSGFEVELEESGERLLRRIEEMETTLLTTFRTLWPDDSIRARK